MKGGGLAFELETQPNIQTRTIKTTYNKINMCEMSYQHSHGIIQTTNFTMSYDLRRIIYYFYAYVPYLYAGGNFLIRLCYNLEFLHFTLLFTFIS